MKSYSGLSSYRREMWTTEEEDKEEDRRLSREDKDVFHACERARNLGGWWRRNFRDGSRRYRGGGVSEISVR